MANHGGLEGHEPCEAKMWSNSIQKVVYVIRCGGEEGVEMGEAIRVRDRLCAGTIMMGRELG